MAESEIKHGRICMLATMGFLVQELFTFPAAYFPKGVLAVNVHGEFGCALLNCSSVSDTASE